VQNLEYLAEMRVGWVGNWTYNAVSPQTVYWRGWSDRRSIGSLIATFAFASCSDFLVPRQSNGNGNLWQRISGDACPVYNAYPGVMLFVMPSRRDHKEADEGVAEIDGQK
jgi:hypothetical protein